MTNAYVLTGTLTDPWTVRLSEPLPVGAGDVRMTVEVVPGLSAAGNAHKALGVLEQIWKEQDETGHVAPSAEEVAEWMRDARKGWSG